MGRPRSNHRPLRAGIAIMPSAGEDHRGTLGTIARRKSDLAKVIVTNVHVVSTHRNNYSVNGTEAIYQGGTAEGNKVGQLYTETINGVEKKSWIQAVTRTGGTNPVDAAALLVLSDPENRVETSFDVHFPNDDEDDHTHIDKRPIVSPTVDPTRVMQLTVVGAGGGQRDVTVLNSNPSENPFVDIEDRDSGETVGRFVFDKTKNFTLSQRNEPSRPHDSGSPILWVDEHGNYRIVGIHFGGDDKDAQNRSRTGFASRASAIEEELGITFGVKMPIVEAGQPKTVLPGAWFILDGSGSRVVEPNAGPLEYYWKAPENAPQPPSSTLLIPPVTFRLGPTLGFTAPLRLGDYLYKLTVKDTNGAKHSDTVTVTVAPNNPPTANAGADKTAYRGQTVELNGSGSDLDGDTLTYGWEQLGLDELGVVPVTPVTINNADQSAANFVAPNQIGALSFKLTVTDSHEASHSDTVTVTVQNREPIALAGPDKLISSHNRVTLEGSVSDIDPDDRSSVAHTWTQHGNNPTRVIFSEVEGRPAQRTFIPTITGSYTFTLTATDQHQLSVSDDVRVRVLPAPDNVIPANVTATAASGRVDINWNEVSMATGYEVQIGVPEDGGEIGYASYPTAALTHRVENLAPNTRYYYRVRVVKDSFVGPWSATASVVTPGETPPTPTADQWAVRYRNNRIQVKIKELPATTPAIDQVKAKLGISPLGTGLGSDTITVTRDMGTRLNRWVNVLTDADAQWQVGTWTAQIRFENTVGESDYSAGKTVVVTPPNNPPVAFAGYHQVSALGATVPPHACPAVAAYISA